MSDALVLAVAAVAAVPLLWPARQAADGRGRRGASAAEGLLPDGALGRRSQDVASAAEAAPSDNLVGDDTDGSGQGGGDGDEREDVLSAAAAMDLIALALTSGVPLVAAVDAVASESGPIVRRHLKQVVAALRWGVDESRAWDGLPDVWRPAGQALALAGVAGVPPGALLRRAATDIRRTEQRRIEEATGRLSVMVVLPLGLCFLPAFALLTVVPVVATLARGLLAGAA
ncbi:type II secretion system F family protein [Rudaeicoccus suwonensis]|uniref:Type II secretion system (T2SS) protein F n=1 Tax=Rudaeicoccus suwonensis TaxID=657409 RepID=A0A561E340_9MICO|nr:type II secretion system F family protein [Rudaeicoccus suwonensis]TWE10001.1 type II secretion system (T2SS) protein F [Rudaeicoccus suwonensis]